MPDRILRRLRTTPAKRAMFADVSVRPENLILPIFVQEGLDSPVEIESMPGVFRHSIQSAIETAQRAESVGVRGILIFGIPSKKTQEGDEAWNPSGIVPTIIREIRNHTRDLVIFTDVCMCSYRSDGHCGVLHSGELDHQETAKRLGAIAVSHALAGADFVSPSSMVDGQVGAIRHALDEQGLHETGILAYTSKFASSLYGPFRDAADSTPQFGDRASYQHSPNHSHSIEEELRADLEEGADLVMVKPGLLYLDVVRRFKQSTEKPIVSYWVSGEYSMLKAAAEKGWIDEKRAVMESLTAFRRAGAHLVITYHALSVAEWLG